ncbi:hypothetical protein RxyAA322_16880 [Rubrobacter xylanophilus]|uniref:Acyl-CoA carboxylase subunit epsilon n=1 Tax=Rubrobacter xylanophilus TaxID=49319 RepID=A0A510HIR3_9ACTN|nr:hypothetical protein [Rubrobacter xylanophilus]BBL79834.1 hypothetical protein RxyAA322_16880 [Rubrobacter xylanophilus]
MSGERVRISRGGTPGPEEAAAIVAALVTLGGGEGRERPARSRWRLSGLLGREAPPRGGLGVPLWAYRGREGRG